MAVSLEFENNLGGIVLGVDEAGRGPLVGAVYAAAVTVPLDLAKRLLVGEWSGINDSKQLSAKRRETLAEVIKTTVGCTWAIASASPHEIDRLNILKATHLAMRRAVEEVAAKLGEEAAQKITVLVDGNPVQGLPYKSQNLVKGDAKSLFIAAASILAKTTRDMMMEQYDEQFPVYNWKKNKGYPTPEHKQAIADYGTTPLHRMTFNMAIQLKLDFN